MDWLKTLTEQDIREAFPVSPWPHQLGAIQDGIATGCRRSQAINITAPCGAGKSACITALVNLCIDHKTPIVVYTNRKLLTKQMTSGLDKAGISYGVRAASMRDKMDMSKLVQVSSMMTEIRRVCEQAVWKVHPAKIVVVDESHLQASGASLKILQQHLSQGALVIGFTATPLGISHLYPFNYIAANNSDLFKCGSLVKARVYCPHQMDLSQIKREKTGEYSVGEIRKKVFSQAIVGYIYQDWKRYNPDARQTICFAPGVSESLYIAERFKAKGVKAVHVDSKNIWVDGDMYTDDENGTVRGQVLKDWDDGKYAVCCNRFVMREGLDFPNIYHGIFATPVGSLKSYVQMVGRVLRRSEATKDGVIITDHGGSYFNHGSPNTDWPWADFYNMTECQIAESRKKAHQENPELEPLICSECGGARVSGAVCPHCGHKGKSRSRVVIERGGQLRKVEEPFYPTPPKKSDKDHMQKLWDRTFWRCKKSGKTFKQALVLFEKENGMYPPKCLSNMPLAEIDWERKIEAVPYRNLRQESANV